MKSWKKWLGTFAGFLFSGYFLFFAFETFSAVDLTELLKKDFLVAIFCATLLNVSLIPLAGISWSILLRSMGSNWKPTKLSAMIGFTQIAKYVPGNIAQHIGRTSIALMNNMPAPFFISSVLAETILLLSASVFIGLLSLSLSPDPIPVFNSPFENILSVAIMIFGASAVILPLLIRYTPDIVRKFARTPKNSLLTIPVPTPVAAAQAFALYSLSYLILGGSLWIIASGQGELINFNIFFLTASFTLAWLVGYLAPGAPAGLGVREGALVFLLSNTGPAEHVLSVVIATRIASILSDALCFMFSAYLIKFDKS